MDANGLPRPLQNKQKKLYHLYFKLKRFEEQLNKTSQNSFDSLIKINERKHLLKYLIAKHFDLNFYVNNCVFLL